jgi:O-antigen ligase/polysaccharide polymerase Wzy-like membrane protein
MPASFKALIVVLTIASVTFRLAKPVALKFSSAGDFSRRRNVWFVLTIVGFISPNFWLFALVAVPLLFSAGRKDTNPVAFYLLLLHVIPAIGIDIPVVGIKHLFQLDIYRLLSFCVLIPTTWRHWRSKDAAAATSGFGVMDVLLLAYGALTIVLYVPYDPPGHVLLPDSFTNTLRRAFLFFADAYVLYFVVSRTCSSRGAIVEALAAFCLSCALIAPVAVFESLKGWLLYTELPWSSSPGMGVYLMRGAALRAQVSAGHSLALGYILAIAFGFWLYLKSHVTSARTRVAVVLLYWLGLLAAYSRGPWVGAVTIYLVFVALGPRALSGLFKATALMTIIFGAILASPLGDRIISVLPFMGGSVDVGSVIYRQRLAERSWELITERPFFGDQLAFQKMEDLRQGQGIIDLVNTYAGIALYYGLVGLFLFIAFIMIALSRTRKLAKRVARSDPDLALLGVSLVACIVGTLVMIAGCSLIFAYEKMFYVLGGLAAAYVRLGQVPQLQPAAASGPGCTQERR